MAEVHQIDPSGEGTRRAFKRRRRNERREHAGARALRFKHYVGTLAALLTALALLLTALAR